MSILRVIPALLCLVMAVHAESPVMSALRSAAGSSTSLSGETCSIVRSTAAGVLAKYVKLKDGNHLSEQNLGNERVWMETNGLRLTRVAPDPVSPADAANGVAESYLVSVESEMYRTYDSAASRWSKWHNGRNLHLPGAIRVERDANGKWSASSPVFSRLILFSNHSDPGSIPLAPLDTIPQAAPLIPAYSVRIPAPLAAAVNPPAPVRLPASPQPVAIPKADGSINKVMPVLIVAVVISAAVSAVPKRSKKCRHSPAGDGAKPDHPPSPATTASVQEPSLPADDPDAAYRPPAWNEPVAKRDTIDLMQRCENPLSPVEQARSSILDPIAAKPDPIDLMQRREHLLSPAEQAFFSILEPIVRASCRISTKVRLADLFDVRKEKGHQGAFNKIVGKHVDFVLTDPKTSRILAAIELDDSSHQRPDRIERDDFVNGLFKAQQLPLLRVPFAWKYNPDDIRAELSKAGLVL